jgi:hypothetical protein
MFFCFLSGLMNPNLTSVGTMGFDSRRLFRFFVLQRAFAARAFRLARRCGFATLIRLIVMGMRSVSCFG